MISDPRPEPHSPLNIPDRYCLKKLLKEKELWTLLAIGLLYFGRPLFSGETYFFRDLYQHFYPQKIRWVQMIRSWELPLWDPFLHGGQPFLADINNMVLYPTNLLYLVLPLPFAFNLDLVFHILLSAASGYLLARTLGVMPVAAIISGALMGFSGYRLSQMSLMNHLVASTFIPLLLLCWNSFLQTKQKRWFIRCCLCGMLQVFAGAPEVSILSMLFLLGWTFVCGSKSSVQRNIGLWISLVLTTVALSMIQILPTTEMLFQSTRSEGESFYSFTGWSLHPGRLPELIFSSFFGPIDGIMVRDYWGARFEDLGYPYIVSIYFGFLWLFLAITGAVSSRFISFRIRAFLGFFAFACLILSFGRNLPFAQWIYDHLEFARLVRYPIKFFTGAMVPVSLLAGSGMHHFFQAEGRIPDKFVRVLWIFSGLFVTLTLLFQFTEMVPSWIQNRYFASDSTTLRAGLLSSFWQATAISLIGTLIFQSSRIVYRSWHTWLLVTVLFADLFLAGWTLNPRAPVEFFRLVPNLARQVHEVIGEGKLFRSWDPNPLIYHVPSNNIVYPSRWRLETLGNYTAALYSIPVVYHEDFDNLAQKEIVRIGDTIHRLPWERRVAALTAAGASLIVTADTISLPDFKQIAVIKNRSNATFFLYQNLQVEGAGRIVSTSIQVDSFQTGINRLTDPQFDVRKNVLVAETPHSTDASCTEQSPKVRLTSQSSRESAFEVSSNCGGYLVLPLPFYQGWHARVNGASKTLSRANLAFSAITVGPGTQVIEISYLPYSFLAGLVLTGCGLAVLLIVTLRSFRLRVFDESALNSAHTR